MRMLDFSEQTPVSRSEIAASIPSCWMMPRTVCFDSFEVDLGGLGGHVSDARLALERLQAVASKSFVLPTSLAWIYLGPGEIDEAFSWVAHAVARDDGWLPALKSNPFLDPLRSDPRLHALMRRLNLG